MRVSVLQLDDPNVGTSFSVQPLRTSFAVYSWMHSLKCVFLRVLEWDPQISFVLLLLLPLATNIFAWFLTRSFFHTILTGTAMKPIATLTIITKRSYSNVRSLIFCRCLVAAGLLMADASIWSKGLFERHLFRESRRPANVRSALGLRSAWYFAEGARVLL